MNIILHVGSLKTGSTYLQSLIWGNLPILASSGICVPKTGVQSDHHYNIALAAGFGYPAARMSEEEADGLLRDVGAELAASEHETALFSSEHFDIGVSPKSIARLCKALAEHRVKVVLYLRNQVDLIQSLYFEHLKWGGVTELSQFAANQLRIGALAYDERVAHWIDAGVEICVLDYNQERQTLATGFLGAIPGAPPLERLTAPRNAVNESLAPEAMEYLRRMNLLVASPGERRNAYVDLYKQLHKEHLRWTHARQLPLPTVLIEALPALTLSNRRLAKMIAQNDGFLQGNLVEYEAQRDRGAHLDMEKFYQDLNISAEGLR